MFIVDRYKSKCIFVECLCWSEMRHLSNIVCSLTQGLENLFVVFQVDVGEHVSSHFVSFAEVCLQAFFKDLTLKLRYDRPRLDQADTENKQNKLLIL